MKKSHLIEQLKIELKHKLQEDIELLDSQPETTFDMEDQIGNFWIVKKAMKESTEEELIQETNIFDLAEMLSNQEITKADIAGIYMKETKARRAVSQGIRGRDRDLKETVKQGSDLLNQLKQKIEDIKTDIQARTQQGNDNPGVRDSIAADIDRLYADLNKKEMALERLQKSLEKEKKSQKKKKDE